MNVAKLVRMHSDEALVIWSLGRLLQCVDETVPGEKEKGIRLDRDRRS